MRVPWYWCGWSFAQHPQHPDLFAHKLILFGRWCVFTCPWVYTGEIKVERA